jgi:hypothetical protein
MYYLEQVSAGDEHLPRFVVHHLRSIPPRGRIGGPGLGLSLMLGTERGRIGGPGRALVLMLRTKRGRFGGLGLAFDLTLGTERGRYKLLGGGDNAVSSPCVSCHCSRN